MDHYTMGMLASKNTLVCAGILAGCAGAQMQRDAAVPPFVFAVGHSPHAISHLREVGLRNYTIVETLTEAIERLPQPTLSTRSLVVFDDLVEFSKGSQGIDIGQDDLEYFRAGSSQVYFVHCDGRQRSCATFKNNLAIYFQFELLDVTERLTSFIDRNHAKQPNENRIFYQAFGEITKSYLFQNLAYFSTGPHPDWLVLKARKSRRRHFFRKKVRTSDVYDLISLKQDAVSLEFNKSSDIFRETKRDTLDSEMFSAFTLDDYGRPHIVVGQVPRFARSGRNDRLVRQIFRELFQFRTKLTSNRIIKARSFSVHPTTRLGAASQLLGDFCHEISDAFNCDSVSISVCGDEIESEFFFDKTGVTRGIARSEQFSTRHGYSVEALRSKNALIISNASGIHENPIATVCAIDIETSQHIRTSRLKYIITQDTKFDEKSAIVVPFEYPSIEGDIRGVLKIGSTIRNVRYSLSDLDEVKHALELVEPVISTINVLGRYDAIRDRAQSESAGDVDLANLHFKADAASGFFHSIGHAINDIDIGANRLLLQAEANARDFKPEWKTAVSEIEELAADAKAIITSYRDRSRKSEMEVTLASLRSDLIEPVENRIKTSIGGVRGCQPRINKPDASMTAYFDTTFAQEVLMNLVWNACRAVSESRSTQGLITIEAGMSQDRHFAQVRVRDNGVGMTVNVAQECFNYGFSTGPGRSRGVGLFFSRLVIQAIGGRLEIANTKVGGGTTMLLSLPRVRVATN